MKSKVMKLAIGVPSGFEVATDFAISLAYMFMELTRRQIPGYMQTQLMMINKRSSLLPALREDIVDTAIKAGCSHLLFIDSDQTFPPDVVHRLAAHNKPVVGANIALKTLPSTPSARNSYSESQPVYSNEKTGLEQVQYLGFGLTLLHLGVFARIPRPWFQIGYKEGLGHIGEDIYFFDELRRLKVPVYVDHDVSNQVGHMGYYMYTHTDVEIPCATTEQ